AAPPRYPPPPPPPHPLLASAAAGRSAAAHSPAVAGLPPELSAAAIAAQPGRCGGSGVGDDEGSHRLPPTHHPPGARGLERRRGDRLGGEIREPSRSEDAHLHGSVPAVQERRVPHPGP